MAEDHGSNPCKYRFESYWGYHYAYLLGLYLGDGCIAKHPRCYKLRIFLHSDNDKSVMSKCAKAMQKMLPNNKVTTYPHKHEKCTEVYCYNKDVILKYFPQHGKGEKHTRHIELTKWQIDIIGHLPQPFLMGLIESDGCRYINRIKYSNKIYEYISYNFTNRSKDIISIFIWACDILGIQYTTPNKRGNRVQNINIYKRDSVNLVEAFGKSVSQEILGKELL